MYYKLKKELYGIPTTSIFNEEGLFVYSLTYKENINSNINDLIKYLIDTGSELLESNESIDFKPKTIFSINNGEEYYILYVDGDIGVYYFNNDYSNPYKEQGNIFLTKKEAEKERDRRKAIYNIKRYCYRNNIEIKEFKEGDYNYYICMYNNGYIHQYRKSNKNLEMFYFNYEYDCTTIIKNCKEDLDLLFNI